MFEAMTIPEILRDFERYTGRLPERAMRAASARREAVTPDLLAALARVAENPACVAREHPAYALHEFAIHLLAEFREKRAYPLIARIFATPGDAVFRIFDDTIARSGDKILGSVYDGDPALLEALIESREVHEVVRATAMEAFLVLERSGQMDRAAVIRYFWRLFDGALEREPSYAWNHLASAVADLPAPELMEGVRRGFRDGLMDPDWISLPCHDSEVRRPRRHEDRWALVTDAVAEMQCWRPARRKKDRPAPSDPPTACDTDRERDASRGRLLPFRSGRTARQTERFEREE